MLCWCWYKSYWGTFLFSSTWTLYWQECSCREKSLNKTPHSKAKGDIAAAPAESEVHFWSDIFTHGYKLNQ